MKILFRWIIISVLSVLVVHAQAITTTWTGLGDGSDWFDNANWNNGTPNNGDTAVVNIDADVFLNAPSADLASFIMTAGTLTFSNWNTSLSATDVNINNAVITCSGPFNEGEMSNRVWIVCSNLTLQSGGNINANSKGYACRTSDPFTEGQGPGAGGSRYGAGGFGGFGGGGKVAGKTYGSAQFPEAPGSSGGGLDATHLGGHGGGAITIDATGDLLIDGTISAVGGASASCSGGSGGAISIACRTLAGSGELNADGGSTGYCADGGGGRIAVRYDTGAQAVLPLPGIHFSAQPGGSIRNPDLGTLWFPDSRFLTNVLTYAGRLVIPGFTSWSIDTLTINNTWIGLPAELTGLTVAGDVLITGNAGILDLGGDSYLTNGIYNSSSLIQFSNIPESLTLSIGGDLIITNGGQFNVYCGAFDAENPDQGALLDITGDIIIASNSTFQLYSSPTNGASALIKTRNLTVEANGKLSADNGGFVPGTTLIANSSGHGPGAGLSARNGAGYGGHGGHYTRNIASGMPYGSLENPLSPGSAGANQSTAGGTRGGGLILVEASETVRVNGTITASCTMNPGPGAGGGSGGAINIACNTFFADNGTLMARGGNNDNGSNSGAGGGGRIAVRYNQTAQDSAPIPIMELCVRPGLNGISYFGGDLGTVYFPDDRFLGETVSNLWAELYLGTTTLTRPSMLIADAHLRLPVNTLDITSNLTMEANGYLEIGGTLFLTNGSYQIPQQNALMRYSDNPTALICGGDLLINSDGKLTLYSGAIDEPFPSFGGRLDIGGHLLVESNGLLAPISNPTNGGSVFITARQVSVLAGGEINAVAVGYAGAPATGTRLGFGPGGGGKRNSGGYGGQGGVYSVTDGVGEPYGSAEAPAYAGSGGGRENYNGGAGGGLVWIQTDNALLIDGLITANGASRTTANGVGSGGGVLLDCKTLTGIGVVEARGGDNTSTGGGRGSSGGGGRIAVWYGWKSPAYRTALYAGDTGDIKGIVIVDSCPTFEGSFSAAGGAGIDHPGDDGTICFIKTTAPPGTVCILR